MATTPQLEIQLDIHTTLEPESFLDSAVPAEPTPLPEIIAALRTVSTLDGLTEAEYNWLATHGTERKGPDGALVFREGEPSSRMNFILAGEVHVRRRHTGPLALFIGRTGQMTGKLPFSRMKGYGGDGYTVGPIWVLDIHESLFHDMLVAIPSMGQRCVNVLLDRVREVTRMEQQAEKLAALGKLAGNLSHELNNPASAAQRSAATLYGQLRQYGDQKYKLGALRLSEEQTAFYQAWVGRIRARMTDITVHRKTNEGVLSETDREESLTRWLQAHNVPEPWNAASALAENFITIDQLEEFAAEADPEVLSLAIAAFASSLRAERMAETVVDATVRIFDLISAIKSYSYMDQAAMQDVDIAQSLESTLSMFGSRLHDITIERDFDPDLPPVSAYGGELTQVWTALIENALDAMAIIPGPGNLRLTAHRSGDMAYIEIWDDGPGVDPAIRSRIFEPFFTTKAVGSGLGLGLDTAQRIVARHSGFLTVESKPGATCFQVRLPFDQAQSY
jgi:signal transduction histidine kinase